MVLEIAYPMILKYLFVLIVQKIKLIIRMMIQFQMQCKRNLILYYFFHYFIRIIILSIVLKTQGIRFKIKPPRIDIKKKNY